MVFPRRVASGSLIGKPGLPGVNAVPAAEAVDAYLAAGVVDSGLDTAMTRVQSTPGSAFGAALVSTIVRESGRVITPEQFGAIGDGVTDDTDDIQAAIDAASAAGGGVVLLTKKYAFTGAITVKPKVILRGATVWQEAGDSTSVGLVAIGPNAVVTVGGLTGGLETLEIDGAGIGGVNPLFGCLLNVGMVLTHLDRVHVHDSAGDGTRFAGTQNTEIVGLRSHQHIGDALKINGGAGALTFVGGHIGTAARAFHITKGIEPSAYPFGPVQLTFVGTIFELYDNPDTTLIGCGEIGAGAHIKFYGCNFTGNAHGTVNGCVVLIHNEGEGDVVLPATAVEFNGCLWHSGPDADHVRIVGNQNVTFTGAHQFQGTAGAIINQDTGSAALTLQWVVAYAAGIGVSNYVRFTNGGSFVNHANKVAGVGTVHQLKSYETLAVRRDTDATYNRLAITRDGALFHYDGTSEVKASIVHASGRYGVSGGWAHAQAIQVVTGVGEAVAVNTASSAEAVIGFIANATAVLTVPDGAAGQRLRLWLSTVTGNAITWPGNITWAPGRSAPRLLPNRLIAVDLEYVSGTAKWVEVSRSTTEPDYVLTAVKDAGIDPATIGLKATNLDPRLITGSTGFSLNNQVLGRMWVPPGTAITNVHVNIGTAGSGVTASIAVYEADGTRSGITGSITTAFHTTGHKTIALTAPIAAQQVGRWVWVSVLVTAGTSPFFSRASQVSDITNHGQTPLRSGYIAGSNGSTVDLNGLTSWHEIWMGLS